MQQLYKEKLVEKMLYKYQKADKFKDNIKKLQKKIEQTNVERFKEQARKMNLDHQEKMEKMKQED